jgi:translation elongation factor EF-Ts
MQRHEREYKQRQIDIIETTAKMMSDLCQWFGPGIMKCKKSLTEALGNTKEAIIFLRKRGIVNVAGKAR